MFGHAMMVKGLAIFRFVGTRGDERSRGGREPSRHCRAKRSVEGRRPRRHHTFRRRTTTIRPRTAIRAEGKRPRGRAPTAYTTTPTSVANHGSDVSDVSPNTNATGRDKGAWVHAFARATAGSRPGVGRTSRASDHADDRYDR